MSNFGFFPMGLSLLGLLATGACHAGRPPLQGPFVPGPVVATSAEPALADDLRAGLAAALAAQGALGGDADRALSIAVLSADASSVAAGAGAQQWQARLVVAVTAAGPVPERVVLQGARSFRVDPADPLAAATARALAFRALSQELMDDAAAWHLSHPPPPTHESPR